MELTRATGPKWEQHWVLLDGGKVGGTGGGGGRRREDSCGPEARDARHALAFARSFLATPWIGRRR